jgi:hypothetical protein
MVMLSETGLQTTVRLSLSIGQTPTDLRIRLSGLAFSCAGSSWPWVRPVGREPVQIVTDAKSLSTQSLFHPGKTLPNA